MSEFTRRGFLRTASVGAAVLGALGGVPMLARADGTTPMDSPGAPAAQPGAGAPLPIPTSMGSTPVVVYFDDLSSGKGRIFFGEQAIEFDNRALVQSVQAVVG